VRDSIGLRCPTKNCQWEHGVPKPDMRDPRINPQAGDRLAKVSDHRVRSRLVISVVAGVICYTPKRVLCHCSREDWQKWAKGTKVPADYQKAIEPYRKQVAAYRKHLDRVSRAALRRVGRKAAAGVMQYAGTMRKLAESPDSKVLYAHEFAYQLLAGPDKRIVIVTPTFDMPGMSTAHAPQAVPSMVEDVECLAIIAKT